MRPSHATSPNLHQVRRRLVGVACLTATQPLLNIGRRKFVRLKQSHPCAIAAAGLLSLWVVSPLCRLSLKMLFVMFGMAHSASCLRRALGLGGERERERWRKRGRALNKRIMSSAARYLAKKVFVHTEERGKRGGPVEPTSVSLRYHVRPLPDRPSVVFLAPFRPRDNVDKTLLRT